MKILVIGSGGREHALVWKLAQSPHPARLWCAPGNAGIARERLSKNGEAVKRVGLSPEDLPGLVSFAQKEKGAFRVVGTDNPLALGIADVFQKHGLRIWGPNQKAAQFESSKAFSQGFMERHGIPTAKSGTFDQAVGAMAYADSLGGCCAVKADGLALGKGVLICRGMAEARRAITEMLSGNLVGAAGRRIVVQELLEGTEISLHAICDGRTTRLFPTAQDHKRALDGDLGLNTGGMGTYTPTPFVSERELVDLGKAILDPWQRGCLDEGIDFRGILYPGVMLTRTGPRVLEFNARFGDRETQVYLPRLETDLVELLEASVNGTLDRVELKWNAMTTVCIVMASAGYPGGYEKGKVIEGLEEVETLPQTKVFHAGTAFEAGQWLTKGGRVLG